MFRKRKVDMIPRNAGLGSYNAHELSARLSVETGSETIVQQHLKNEVDINTIVKRFGITGQMPFGVDEGIYGDFTGITDYESALAKVTQADESFMTLPAEIRERFKNSPAELIRFAQSVDEDAFMAAMKPPGKEVKEEVPPV